MPAQNEKEKSKALKTEDKQN